ncbi:MAG: hypothetical protein HZA31_12300 [Opitutae bacterium]|nr:hypothetical protein [Opitutae bacterium]
MIDFVTSKPFNDTQHKRKLFTMEALALLFFGGFFFGLIGAVIGRSRGIPGAGFWWGFFLGPIGWIITLMIRTPEDDRRALEAYEERLSADRRHTENIEALRRLESPQQASSQPATRKWRVSKDGNDLGALDMPAIKLRLRTGELLSSDLVFDEQTQDWVAISTVQDLATKR